MSTVFRCVSTWRAAPGKEYEVKVVSMEFDSKGHVILLCNAVIKPKVQIQEPIFKHEIQIKPEGDSK